MAEESENRNPQMPQSEPRAAQQPAEPKSGTFQNKKEQKNGWLSKLLGGQALQSKWVMRQIPLLLLICFYALVLVYMRYQVEDLTRSKLEAQERINYLRETRIELQKHYQETIKISQIAELLDSTGVGLTAGPPYEI